MSVLLILVYTLVHQETLEGVVTPPVLQSVSEVRMYIKYLLLFYSLSANLAIVGSMPQLISNFAPPVSSGYIVSPSNPRITLTNSGDLNVSSLGPEDTGIYTLASPDHQGASIVIELSVLGMTKLILIMLQMFLRPSICHWY